MNRRVAVLAAVAGAALAAGAGSALWRRHSAMEESARSDDIWSQSFETLAGQVLPMKQFRGKPLLLNFWATWCAPCVAEIPLLDSFAREAAGRWQVLALAVDNRAPVRRFIDEHRLSISVAFAATMGLDLSRSLGNRVGALPFTAVFAADGHVAAVQLGPVHAEILKGWMDTVK